MTPAFGGQYSIQLSYGRTIEEHFSPSPVSPRLALLVKCSILPIRDTHYLRKSDFSFSNQKPNNETNGCPEPLFVLIFCNQPQFPGTVPAIVATFVLFLMLTKELCR